MPNLVNTYILDIYDLLTVMALERVKKRTEHHGYSIGIYLQEQMVGYENIGRQASSYNRAGVGLAFESRLWFLVVPA